MGSRGSSNGYASYAARQYLSSTNISQQGNVIQPQVAMTAAQATQDNNAAFKAVDNSPYHDLYNGRQYYQNQTFDIDTLMAIQNYISPTTESGSLYSMSQNLNYALANGQKLTANQQYVYDGMMAGMHNLGYNVYLYRYDHSSMINKLLSDAGLNGSYENYSETQLKQALVGRTYQENKLLSTSYNNFKNCSDPSTFTSRAVKITYLTPAKTQVLMPGDAQSNARNRNFYGEVVMSPVNQYKLKDVKFNGKKARRQGTQSYTLPQIELIVEVG